VSVRKQYTESRIEGGVKMKPWERYEKPILFSTEMVKAILKNIKRATRRPIKYSFLPGYNPKWTGYKAVFEYGKFFFVGSNGEPATKPVKAPAKVGDILYVRETWCYHKTGGWYGYKADGDYRDLDLKWHPSIHMPKEAARIWLKVTNVRVERLQDITSKDIEDEGTYLENLNTGEEYRFVWVIEFERIEK